jgi:hypothetical protein
MKLIIGTSNIPTNVFIIILLITFGILLPLLPQFV